MENMQSSKNYVTIDIAHIFRMLWQRVWIIALAAILTAGIGFGISAFVIKPDYASSVMLYVNNSSIDLGNLSIAQLNATRSLVDTYTLILKNRTTLEEVIREAEVDYTFEELSGMIKASSVNETEIMRVTVTGKDPYEVSKIANTITDVLTTRVSKIIKGASMTQVDKAVPNVNKVAPNITRNTAVSMIMGGLVSTVIIAVWAMMDDTIHSEEYIIENYDYPILAKIPNLMEAGSGKYRRYGYYYRRRDQSRNNT